MSMQDVRGSVDARLEMEWNVDARREMQPRYS
jgi:hypothetical protein